ncbi:rRNA methylase [Achromatium sp. WMS3]|nr:rRNA methylase [Achromatium sp. WMS3]
MFHVILYQPEIPPNTGNIIRLCANTGSSLHLIKPLGFDLSDKQLRRAGLDYHEWVDISVYPNLDSCLDTLNLKRIFAISTKGKICYTQVKFQPQDAFLFGPETRGLPKDIRDSYFPDQILYLPMYPNNRSLNLSNAVAVVVFEAWRQIGFVAR